MFWELAPEVREIGSSFGVMLASESQDDSVQNSSWDIAGSVIDHMLEKVSQAKFSVGVS